jgi:uncharacterized membrane protein
MRLRPFHVVSAICLLSMLGLSAYAWTQLPPGEDVPIHWDVNGSVNGHASKTFALLFVPLLTLGLVILLSALPRLDPRRAHMRASAGAYVVIGSAVVILMLVVHAAIVLVALGVAIDPTVLIGAGIGLLFVVIGSQLARTQSNWFLGVRTPWTLESERSWQRTHALAGRLFIVLGAVTVALALVAPQLSIWWLVAGVLVLVGTTFAYSYVVWRDDPDRVPHREAVEEPKSSAEPGGGQATGDR